MKEIKLGVIGSNFVSDWLCCTVKKTAGITCHALYSRTEEKGRDFAEKYGIEKVYTDLEAFFASDIDAVYIASPNFLHYPQARKALLSGKHVLLEKPATLNREQFDSLCSLAKERGLVLTEAMRPGHDPAIERIREAMEEIGPIRYACFDYCQYSSRYDRFRRGELPNAFNPALGNAALMDIGCYALHVCLALFGSPKRVWAHSVTLRGGMEGAGTALLSYENMTAQVVYSKITESAGPSVIAGEDGHILIGKLSTMEYAVLKKRNGETRTLFTDREENNMRYEVENFVDMICGRGDGASYLENTRRTLCVMDEIRRQSGIRFSDDEDIEKV